MEIKKEIFNNKGMSIRIAGDRRHSVAVSVDYGEWVSAEYAKMTKWEQMLFDALESVAEGTRGAKSNVKGNE